MTPYHKIEGYATANHFRALAMLDEMINVEAGVAEIGTLFGRFFCMLNHFSGMCPSFAIDLFDDQEKNIPTSGDGRELTVDKFVANLDNHDRYGGSNVRIIEGDSLSINYDIIKTINEVGRVKFFSVDGGHDAVHATNDLRIAQNCIVDGGIVVMDDFFNIKHPGPTQALLKYLESHQSLIPFFLLNETLFLCSFSYYRKYFNYVRQWSVIENYRGGMRYVSEKEKSESFRKFDMNVFLTRVAGYDMVCYSSIKE